MFHANILPLIFGEHVRVVVVVVVVVVAFVFSNTVINFSTFIISIDKFSNMNIKWSWSPYQTITRLGETAEGW